MSIFLSVCLSCIAFWSVCLSLGLSLYPFRSVCLPIFWASYPSPDLSVCLSVCPSVCLKIHLSLSYSYISTRGVTIHPLHWWIDVYFYDQTTLICTWKVGLSDEKNCSKTMLTVDKSNELIQKNRLNVRWFSLHVGDVITKHQQTTKHSVVDGRREGSKWATLVVLYGNTLAFAKTEMF